jgi:hypothetical protein
LGSQYVLGLNAVNCCTGDLLAEEQETAQGKEQVLTALGNAATKVREKLGESLASVKKYQAPPENVTTPSLEALQAYSLGYHTFDVTNDIGAAIPLFQRAISLDPNFCHGVSWGSGELFYPQRTHSGSRQRAQGLRSARADERAGKTRNFVMLRTVRYRKSGVRAHEIRIMGADLPA